MTSRAYDAIVIGLGAMGAATLLQLTRRGQRVLGLDRWDPPHAWGNTHGDTRITRAPSARASNSGARHALPRDLAGDRGRNGQEPANAAVVHGKPGFVRSTVVAAE